MTTPNAAYTALALVPGIGRARLRALLEAFGSADAVFAASSASLRRVHTITTAAATAIRESSPAAGEKVISKVAELGGWVLIPTDPGFPACLRQIPESPTLLFGVGRMEMLGTPAVALVGSRDHSSYGAEAMVQLATGLARAGLTVVSGMARGLDAVAHAAALDSGGQTVGVLGNGLGVVYPAANRVLYERMWTDGCLLTEFPPGERPNAGSFPRRNRLISGLCRSTVVIEAGERSGALITAEAALAQGREVMAVPGPITSARSRGTNRLIQMGAKPVLDLNDVLEEYGLTKGVPQVSLPSNLSAEELRVLDLLAGGGEQIDEVTSRLSCGAGEALAVLTSLEIRGLVLQGPGKIFRRIV